MKKLIYIICFGAAVAGFSDMEAMDDIAPREQVAQLRAHMEAEIRVAVVDSLLKQAVNFLDEVLRVDKSYEKRLSDSKIVENMPLEIYQKQLSDDLKIVEQYVHELACVIEKYPSEDEWLDVFPFLSGSTDKINQLRGYHTDWSENMYIIWLVNKAIRNHVHSFIHYLEPRKMLVDVLKSNYDIDGPKVNSFLREYYSVRAAEDIRDWVSDKFSDI